MPSFPLAKPAQEPALHACDGGWRDGSHLDGARTHGVREVSAQLAAERATGSRVTHIESVPVVETFRGQTVWEGMVEVFIVAKPPPARAYAWAVEGDNGPQYVAVLGVQPINSPLDAVRAWIVSARK